MGDRTHVALIVPVYAEPLLDALEAAASLTAIDVASLSDGTLLLTEEEVDYANSALEPILRAAHIPYDKRWDAGCEYSAGEGRCRRSAEGDYKLDEAHHDDMGEAYWAVLKAYQRGGVEAAKPLLDATLELHPVAEPLTECQQSDDDRAAMEQQITALKAELQQAG